jgi:hypothetical protein
MARVCEERWRRALETSCDQVAEMLFILMNKVAEYLTLAK